MSTTVFPTLKGRDIVITRKPIFNTNKPQAVSGKEVAIARWSSPRYQWTVKFNILRQGTIGLNAFTELATLRGFFETLLGGYDSFLFQDPDDYIVTAQALGNTDGSAGPYQLKRTSGGATINILAPNMGATFNLYVDAVLKTQGVDYSVTSWGSTTPGQITFLGGHVPAAAKPLTIDFSYYFPCRWVEDEMDFTRFVKQMYSQDGNSFKSIK